MASYASYKKVTSEGISDGSITRSKLAPGAGACRKVQWIYNERGMRCLRVLDKVDVVNKQMVSVVTGVFHNTYKVTFEIWSMVAEDPDTHVVTVVRPDSRSRWKLCSKTIETDVKYYTVCAGGAWRW